MKRAQIVFITSFILSFIAYSLFSTLIISTGSIFSLIPHAFVEMYSAFLTFEFSSFLYDLMMFVAVFTLVFVIAWLVKLIRRRGNWTDIVGIVIFLITMANLGAVLLYRNQWASSLASTDEQTRLITIYAISMMAIMSVAGLLVGFNGITIVRVKKTKEPKIEAKESTAPLKEDKMGSTANETVIAGKTVEKETLPTTNELTPSVVHSIVREELDIYFRSHEPLTLNRAILEEPVANEKVTEEEEDKPAEEPIEEEPVVVEEKVTPTLDSTEDKIEEPDELNEAEEGKFPKIVSIPFADKLKMISEEDMASYTQIRDYLLAYGFHSRISHTAETFRLHRQEIAKIAIGGKTIKLFLALNPKEYANSTIPVRDSSSTKAYKEVPTMIKIKSALSVKRAFMLIDDVAKANGQAKK